MESKQLLITSRVGDVVSLSLVRNSRISVEMTYDTGSQTCVPRPAVDAVSDACTVIGSCQWLRLRGVIVVLGVITQVIHGVAVFHVCLHIGGRGGLGGRGVIRHQGLLMFSIIVFTHPLCDATATLSEELKVYVGRQNLDKENRGLKLCQLIMWLMELQYPNCSTRP